MQVQVLSNLFAKLKKAGVALVAIAGTLLLLVVGIFGGWKLPGHPDHERSKKG